MSAKRDPDEQYLSEDDDNVDDYDDDDEADFVPDGDDSDDDCDDEGDEYEDKDDNKRNGNASSVDPNSFLQGHLLRQITNDEKIIFDGGKKFCLFCDESLPTWSVHSPAISDAVKFVGWIQDPSQELEFSVTITKQDKSKIDIFDEKLLKAQSESLTSYNPQGAAETKSSSSTDVKKVGVDLKAEGSLKQAASVTKSSKSPTLKSPPPYSLKQPPSEESDKSPDNYYRISGSLVTNDSSDIFLNFHGIFHPPAKSTEQVFLICSISGNWVSLRHGDASKQSTTTAAARKRGRGGTRGSGDDDSIDDDAQVEYQELIDLHDDSRVSTEELRRRYYGDTRNLESTYSQGGTKRYKSNDDQEEDDCYGF